MVRDDGVVEVDIGELEIDEESSGENAIDLQSGDVLPAGYKPGDVLGSYRLLEVLGAGGMGMVFMAEHVRLGRKVALKLLRPDYAQNPNASRRFFGEARAVNQINHENIVQITDFVENEGFEKYYIMEMLDGSSLGDLLAREGPMSLGRMIKIMTQVCSALSAVHEADIIHRDLKPDNIFLISRSGKADFVKLLDFGVAKLSDFTNDGVGVNQTAAGVIIGTPAYMSPEQASGKKIDHRTDIYSLGIILFEVVTGAKPFRGKTFGDMVLQHMTVAPPKPSEITTIPKTLERLILKCLAKEPDERPQTMVEVAQALNEIAQTEGIDLEAPGTAPLPVQKRSVPWLAIAAVAVALVSTAFLFRERIMEEFGLVAAAQPEAPVTDGATAVGNEAAVEVATGSSGEKVEIAFDSVPRGAVVYQRGQRQPLGETPFSLPLARAAGEATFEFRLAGHLPAEQTIRLDEDTRVTVTLARDQSLDNDPAHAKTAVVKPKAPQPKVRVKGGKKKTNRVDRGGVMDPFNEE
jgi:serine/threonine-protein kinase